MPIDPLLLDIPLESFGARVLVRRPRVGDGKGVFEAVEESRNELRPWMPWEGKTTCAEDCERVARRAIGKWNLREDLMLTIWDKETSRYIGSSGLHRINWEVPSFEIGYWIRTSEQGKGYATEAVRVVRDLAFDTLGANRIYIKISSTNLCSIADAKRAQFIHEGTLRCDERDTFGNLRDTEVFALTRDDFLAL